MITMSRAEVFVFSWWVREKHPSTSHSDQEDLDQAVKVILHASIYDFEFRFSPLIQGMNPQICQGDYRPEESILKSYKGVMTEGSNENSLEGEQKTHSCTCD